MPVIRIDLWKGRAKEMRRELIKKLTETVVDTIGCPSKAVHIIINEVEKDNWGIAGEVASAKFPDK